MQIVKEVYAAGFGAGEPAQLTDLEGIFEKLVNAFIGLASIALFVMLLLGGIKYITSGGDPKKIEGAKSTLTYAIGGMIFVLLSYLILVLIKTLTGAEVTQFKIQF